MAKFSQEIEDFQRYGTYEYKFDPDGNLTFNSSSVDFSKVYLAFPLKNIVYNIAKLKSFYDPTFTEFVPAATSSAEPVNVDAIQEQVNVLEEENTALKSQLDTLTASQPDSSEAAADIQATKQVILELRKALGEGRVDSDFSESFPYAPIRKETL